MKHTGGCRDPSVFFENCDESLHVRDSRALIVDVTQLDQDRRATALRLG